MRRRAHVLSATALIGAVLGAAAPAAYAEPAAQVDPHDVAPGGTVTISVSCDPTGGPAPETIDASSQAFEQGTVKLQRVPGNDDPAGGPSYQGTATIAPAADFETGPDAKDAPTERDVDGTCPAPPGGEEKQWSATFTVSLHGNPHQPPHGPSHDPSNQFPHDPSNQFPHDPSNQLPHDPSNQLPHDPSHQPTHQPPHDPTHDPTHHSTHHPAPVQRGVHAGSGGTFTDSVPALVAGGLLIAGAFGAAVHRLLRRDRRTS
ncbi:hypothetical protein [Streptomyces capitiformicae]|uniref:Uncharacterized protein n=1 Tax=Streptomyces capitiformicae TaxID=2014920 RepID=A0A919GQW2_9ACTN|nr:hypothetical protein [Streptomyces capitiformicae]GHH88200.1 hypothetical protein GCM10017771_32570 [Streptomyces capitiformicae]